MSLSLDLGSKPDGLVALMPDNKTVCVGGLEITTADFFQLAIYVLTNTDLHANDPRLHFMNQIAKLNQLPGYNPGGVRLG